MHEKVIIEGREYVVLEKVAALTHYEPVHLRRLAKAGQITAVQLGRSWFVDLQSIEAYKAAKPQRKPRAEPGRRRKS